MVVSTLLIVLLLSPSFATAQTQLFKSADTKHHTQVALIADVHSIQPGVPFTAGVLMNMDEGWHTYWKNGGESGLPTEIKWTLPDGFIAGEIEWPLPHKYNESGDVLTYGYAGENMLLVQITPSRSLKSGTSVTLKADVSWLECEKLCIPGDAKVEMTLPVADRMSTKAHAELFEKYRAQVPRPLLPSTDFSLKTETKNREIVLTLEATVGKSLLVKPDEIPDFFPEIVDELSLGRTIVVADGRRAVLRIPLSAYEKVDEALTLKGVLLYQLQGGELRSGTVEIPLPKEFTSTIPIEGESGSSTLQSGGGLFDQTFTTIETAQSEQSLALFILFAVIGGLLLNVMPCVLPVIGLKIFGLVRMSGDEPVRVKRLGWFFSFGILASFLVLALLVIFLKTAGEHVGWGFQFQEPLFVIGMSTVVFAFGLSLFGVFEISLPFMLAFVGLGSALEKRDKDGGYVASFSEGVFATILATPCTAPFLGSAMGFAFSQPAYIILLLFASVAFGMSLPYLILTAKPKWMRFLPKPGEWMVTAKQFMGFLMMGTMVWLLQVLGSQLGMEAVIWTAAFLLFVALACWIVGRFATLTATRTKYFISWGVAILLVIAGYKLFIGDVLEARDVLAQSDTSGIATSSPQNVAGVEWHPFSVESLESHLRENKTVFLDFTAEWCLTCKVNEKTVLADKAVVERLNGDNIISMKADWTNRNEAITRLLQKFGRSGVPLYVVFPAGRPTEPIVLPEVITTGIVLDALARATGM
ncbi:MAG: thioredoxin family protein [Bacteroidetes bacterium]|nr:thioredoxin family protein [Bacteroidota bacterium]MCW5897564.1 thioredoxin family protein [Bacteroidota bacterium]